MHTPYPWKQEKTHQKTIKLTNLTTKLTLPLLPLSLLLNPLGTLLTAYHLHTYNKNNTPPQQLIKHHTLAFLATLPLNLLLFTTPWQGTINLLKHLSHQPLTPLDWARIPTAGISLSILLTLPLLLSFLYNKEHKTRAYLLSPHPPTKKKDNKNEYKPTRKQKQTQKENEEKIKNTDTPTELVVGTVAYDPLPWRQHRYGLRVGIPLEEFSHAITVGSTGSGKTVFLSNLTDTLLRAGYSSAYLDFKGDGGMENSMGRIAEETGTPFYTFWTNQNKGFHFDPLNQIDTTDQASVLTTALGIVPHGDSAIYAETTEEFLGLQFEVNKLGKELKAPFGKQNHESTADYLLRTIGEEALLTELNKATAFDPKTQERIEELKNRIRGNGKKRNLDRLQINLSKLIGLMGETMRPHPTPERNINLTQAINQGAVFYFGMPPGASEIGLRVLGALLLRNFASLSSERATLASQGKPVGKPLVIVADEIQRLKELANLATEIPQQGRSSKTFLTISCQTFKSLPEEFVGEMKGNAKAIFLLNTTEDETINEFAGLNKTFGTVPTLNITRGSETEENVVSTGELRETTGKVTSRIEAGHRINPDLIKELPPQHAFVYFPSSPSQAVLDPWQERVRKDEAGKDIPLVRIVSKDYILESATDPSSVERRLEELAGLDRAVKGGKKEKKRKEEQAPVNLIAQQVREVQSEGVRGEQDNVGVAFNPDDW